MNPRRIHAADVPFQPWRNGGGVMQELLLQPQGANGWVRVGLAEIASDGAFSAFPDVERRFVVLQGGVVLTIDGVPQRCGADSEPLVFDGGAATHCALIDGPTHVLNLLLHGARGDLRTVAAHQVWRPGSGWCALYALAAGRVEQPGSAQASIEVGARTLLAFDPAPDALVFLPATGHGARNGYWLSASPAQGG